MAKTKAEYYLPHGSPWPIVASVSMFAMALGGALWLNGAAPGRPVLFLGLAGLTVMMFGWLGTVIRENIAGLYSGWVDRSFRQGMAWFIFSKSCFLSASSGRCSTPGRWRCPGWAATASEKPPTACCGRDTSPMAHQRPRDRGAATWKAISSPWAGRRAASEYRPAAHIQRNNHHCPPRC